MKRLVVALVAVVAVLFGAVPANAAVKTTYNKTAKSVATAIHCKSYKHEKSAGPYAKDLGTCKLGSKPVNVITFKNSKQQATWAVVVQSIMPKSNYFCSAPGTALWTDRASKADAAWLCKKVKNGKVKHGF